MEIEAKARFVLDVDGVLINRMKWTSLVESGKLKGAVRSSKDVLDHLPIPTR